MIVIKQAKPFGPVLKEIKTIFPSATGVGIILPEIHRGLAVHFNKRADFFSELKIDSPSAIIIKESLFDLVCQFGFVVLKNCVVAGVPDVSASQLSRGKDSDGRFIQDPFHYDVPPPDCKRPLPKGDYVSAIFKTAPDERFEKTFYALETDVKAAIEKLDKNDLSDEVIEALEAMVRPDYHFRLYHPNENWARQIIKLQYPEFVEDVFKLIPNARKYSQGWLKDVWEVFIHANTFGDALHARPTGRMMMYSEPPFNLLSGMYIYK